MRPALCWASYLLTLCFPAASYTSADRFGSLSCASARVLAPSPCLPALSCIFSVAFPRFGSLSHASVALTHASARFLALLALLSHASAQHEQEQRRSFKNDREATAHSDYRRRAASLSIESGLAEARRMRAFERLLLGLLRAFGFVYIRAFSPRSSVAEY